MSIWYRIQDAGRDPQALLDPAAQWSRTWHPTTRTCPICGGTGIHGESWYCEDEECYDLHSDVCERCEGTCEVPEDARRGVSVCASPAELAAYFRAHMVHPDYWADEVMVTLAGDLAGEDDFDADAQLVIPSVVIAVTPVREVPELATLLADVGAAQ